MNVRPDLDPSPLEHTACDEPLYLTSLCAFQGVLLEALNVEDEERGGRMGSEALDNAMPGLSGVSLRPCADS